MKIHFSQKELKIASGLFNWMKKDNNNENDIEVLYYAIPNEFQDYVERNGLDKDIDGSTLLLHENKKSAIAFTEANMIDIDNEYSGEAVVFEIKTKDLDINKLKPSSKYKRSSDRIFEYTDKIPYNKLKEVR